MKKLFTIDDFMVAFISALGYGFGYTIPMHLGWPQLACMAACFALGIALEEVIIYDGGIGVFDMLGVVESVKYDDTTMQTSGEGALPQSYTYADGTLTWTTAGENVADSHLARFQREDLSDAAKYKTETCF